MNRLRNIKKKKASSSNPIINGKRYYKYLKYPEIPLDIEDIYITAKVGDRVDTLAHRFYGDDTLWWVIITANPDKIKRDTFFIKPGLLIRIPTDIEDILDDFERLNTI
jgi:nucleoid-associated protein YgaU|tara:strand:- start:1145 stop:1468 length:324 start_codon:yes stop_codon:yes gene_type:complete